MERVGVSITLAWKGSGRKANAIDGLTFMLTGGVFVSPSLCHALVALQRLARETKAAALTTPGLPGGLEARMKIVGPHTAARCVVRHSESWPLYYRGGLFITN